jgi:hypothetical protein
MTDSATLDRRSFLAVTGGATLYGATASQAGEPTVPPRGVLIALEGVVEADAFAAAIDAEVAVLGREDDPVRFWAQKVAPALTAGAPVYGVTTWADYLVLRGAASESGRKLRFESGGGGRRSTSSLDRAAALSVERFRGALAARALAENGRMGWLFA